METANRIVDAVGDYFGYVKSFIIPPPIAPPPSQLYPKARKYFRAILPYSAAALVAAGSLTHLSIFRLE